MGKSANSVYFTVIIPHKNIPSLLKRCLDSIPRRDDIQIIVVDDCSDDSVANSNEFPGLDDEHVEVIFSKEAKGSGYARNIGLSKAVGKWVIFADADDFFTDHFSRLIDGNKDDEAELVYFHIESVYSDDITRKAIRSSSKQELFDTYEKDQKQGEILFRVKYGEPWGKMIKRSLIYLNDVRFDEIPVSNDYFFSVQVGCLAKKVKIVNEPIYVVTLRTGSLSYKYGDTIDKLLIRLDVSIRVQSYINKFGYEMRPMPIRGLMVLLLKMNFSMFLTKIFEVNKAGISIRKLLIQMFDPKFFKQ